MIGRMGTVWGEGVVGQGPRTVWPGGREVPQGTQPIPSLALGSVHLTATVAVRLAESSPFLSPARRSRRMPPGRLVAIIRAHPIAGLFAYGAPGWIPVVGDRDGNGHSTAGVVDLGSRWY